MTKSDREVRDEEIWKPIPGTSKYEVSNLGRIRSHAGPRTKGGVLSSGYPRKGYKSVTIEIDGTRKTRTIHRIVATVFIGPIPERHEVNHIDGNKFNNELRNLEIVTPSLNQRHKAWILKKKTQSRVGDEVIARIRFERNVGRSLNFLADKYGYSKQGIRYICGESQKKKDQTLSCYGKVDVGLLEGQNDKESRDFFELWFKGLLRKTDSEFVRNVLAVNKENLWGGWLNEKATALAEFRKEDGK